MFCNETKYRNPRKQCDQKRENQCQNQRTYPKTKIQKATETWKKKDQNREFESVTYKNYKNSIKQKKQNKKRNVGFSFRWLEREKIEKKNENNGRRREKAEKLYGSLWNAPHPPNLKAHFWL